MKKLFLIFVGLAITACTTSQVDDLHRAAFTAVAPQKVSALFDETPTPSVCDNKPTVDNRGLRVPGAWRQLTTEYMTVINLPDGSREAINMEGDIVNVSFALPGVPIESGISFRRFRILPGPDVLVISHSLADQRGTFSGRIYFWFWTCGGTIYIVTDVQSTDSPFPTPTPQRL